MSIQTFGKARRENQISDVGKQWLTRQIRQESILIVSSSLRNFLGSTVVSLELNLQKSWRKDSLLALPYL